MIISLYLYDKIVNFRLPKEVSGSYSFDSEDVDSKLINIDAIDGKWVLYSTTDSKIIKDNAYIKGIELVDGNFYVINRDKINYLIYASSGDKSNILTFKYANNFSLLIGSNDGVNIRYNCPYLNSLVKITNENNTITLEKEAKSTVYNNKISVIEPKRFLNFGDQIEIFGLQITILKELILIKNIQNKLSINLNSSNLTLCEFPSQPAEIDEEIKDRDLYVADDYYSKSPRLRRLIEPKEIRLTQPPKTGESKEMPLILTIGPMMTMGVMSLSTLFNVLLNISNKQTPLSQAWPQLLTSGVMLVSMLLWPTITQIYNKKQKEQEKQEIETKYTNYLMEKKLELDKEYKMESVILDENLITVQNCLEIVNRKKVSFWNKRNDQSDFLEARIGMGNEYLKAKLVYGEEDFTIDENALKKKADDLNAQYKYLKNVPIGYSFYENKITAIMGNYNKSLHFVYNILLQLLTFYSYEDLKIVIFTNKKKSKNWEFLRYLNHTFNNERNFRFFASDFQSVKQVAEFLNVEASIRASQVNGSKSNEYTPYYLIIVDDCDKLKRFDFVKTITETEENIGFSMIIIDNLLSRLPSKCNNFISIGDVTSTLLKNSYDEQEQTEFTDEIDYNINMMNVAKRFSNIPIEFQEGFKELPNSISFLEMEKVGKVEQLNILNRWNTNDSTQSLRAEVGVDEAGDLMYLDLHEKYHGPHGLIAGMTGSGKSEFIITYILSMAINYSPDDVSFILIDYKGGGLAYAFSSKELTLPHLAGTITNLDKAEMDRTLVSIDSEIKRRQEKFNEARDLLGESTMDIYKYQRYYKEGQLEEPIPHLFIICDEFAELKSQQPDFMDNLISVARIGRSLGVHLILATQKPSGVVNDQIWSNTKFRVCLKVQDESDSKEMLKRGEAASIRQTGRFYLQVGYDEYFALGQSAWCGDKYYPSEKIVKQVDKSVNFIDDCGSLIKSIQASNNIKIAPQGEQLNAVLKNIISIAKFVGKDAKKLWLPNIEDVILIDEIEEKYNVVYEPFNVKAIIGEYDAPELQKQGLVSYEFLKDGNSIIYSIDGAEREMLLNSIIFSTIKNYSVDEINYYIIDYGSESLSKFSKFPHIGGMVYASDDEKYNNLIKYITDEIDKRKKIFSEYSGNYMSYIKNSGKTLPLKVVILNNYDSIYENNQTIYDILPDLVRDSERYGIIFIFTADSLSSVHNKIAQNCPNLYVLKLKDPSSYATSFGIRTKLVPRDIFGRGLYKSDVVHEFQTASIVSDENELNNYINEYIQNIKTNEVATKIPVLPEIVEFNDIKDSLKGIRSIPVGITKDNLKVYSIDYLNNLGNIITSNRINTTEKFVKSLIYNFKSINVLNIIIDAMNTLELDKNIYQNYYNENFDNVMDMVINFVKERQKDETKTNGVILIYGVSKLIAKLGGDTKLLELTKLLKEYEEISIIIVDSSSKLKENVFNEWFKIFSVNDGIWIGRGIVDQNLLHISQINREMTKEINSDMGYVINESSATLCKLINYGDSTYEK